MSLRSYEPNDVDDVRMLARWIADSVPARKAVALPSDEPAFVERILKAEVRQRQPRFTQPLVERSETRAAVLLYHNIDLGLTSRSVWPWDFEAQILKLRENGTEIIALSQLLAFLDGRIARLPKHVAVLTIDDGEKSVYRYAWPILRKLRVPFALGIITHPVEVADAVNAVGWDDLREMGDSGLCEVASHGHDHLWMPSLKDEQLRFELEHSRDLIEKRLGIRPDVFVYPLGATSTRVAHAARRAGYRAALTATGSLFDQRVPLYSIPRFKIKRTTSFEALSRFFETPPYNPSRWGRGG